MARPVKYKEKLQVMSVALEPSMIDYIKELANESNVSVNEQITNLILTSDKIMASDLIKKFHSLKDGINQLTSTMASVSTMIFKPLEDFSDSDLDDVLNDFKGDVSNRDAINYAVTYLFSVYQDKKLVKNERIINSALVKLIIRKRLLQLRQQKKK